ncbi:MAG: FMN-binding protein [Candidatus Pacebacteria bacterium]|jgi:uncharacterized protein with FMN-binding domain|nr:FMN-binding protein [Candidatus Paceibacterota bacterium]
MISFLSKNIQKFLVFFFTAISLILVVMGVSRIKKPVVTAEVPQPAPQAPVDTQGATTIAGDNYQTPWGSALASVTVKDGKVIAVKMPSIPPSPPSVYAEPFLVDQALKAGGANIQGVSGATYTSLAFKSSLESAIAKAAAQGQTITPNTTTSAQTAGAVKPSVPRQYRDDDEGENEWDD